MKICFPVSSNNGFASEVHGHFGSAPGFLVVDTATGETAVIKNGDRIHQHGGCNPLAGLGGAEVDAVVVGGIGGGALYKLNAAGLRVFQARRGNVGDNVELFRNNELPEFLPGHTCGGHGHGHGCGH